MSTTQQNTSVANYNVDASHSQVQFQVKHMGFSKVTGQFNTFESSFQLDPDNLETLSVEAVIQAESVTTANDERDGHLRSEDFFAVEEHPEIRFASTGVKNVGEDTLTLVGDLTIRGVTKPVELDVTYRGEAQDPWGNQRVSFKAQGSLNRKEFGLTWNQVLEAGGVLVSENVELILEIQGVEASE